MAISPRDDIIRELAKQRERIDELEAEVAFLRDQLAVPDAEREAAIDLGIPEWLVPAFHLFVASQVVTRRALLAVGDKRDWGPSSDYSHLAVHRLRRRLGPHGIVIENRWGIGYRTSSDSHARLKALVN